MSFLNSKVNKLYLMIDYNLLTYGINLKNTLHNLELLKNTDITCIIQVKQEQLKDGYDFIPSVINNIINKKSYTIQIKFDGDNIIKFLNIISEKYNTKQDWNNVNFNFLDNEITNEEGLEFSESINSNYENGWDFSLVKENINHLHMNWRFRHSDEGVIASFLIPYMIRAFEGKNHNIESNQIDIAHFLCHYIDTEETFDENNKLDKFKLLNEEPYNQIENQLYELQIDIPEMIDNKIFLSIQQNSIVNCNSEDETDILRNKLLNFGQKIRYIQHFCFHSKIVGLCKILGKLLTRIWWIFHTSSPIMKPFQVFDLDDINESESDDEDFIEDLEYED
jgi:hypothetical protein